MACLRKIEGVMRRDRIRNEEIFNRLNIRCGIINRIGSMRLRYFGHMNRMKNERYPKINIQWLRTWNQEKGRQKKPWIDMIREDGEELHMMLKEATCMAQGRRMWRATIDERLTHAIALPGP